MYLNKENNVALQFLYSCIFAILLCSFAITFIVEYANSTMFSKTIAICAETDYVPLTYIDADTYNSKTLEYFSNTSNEIDELTFEDINDEIDQNLVFEDTKIKEETREPADLSVLTAESPYVPEYKYGKQPSTPVTIPNPISDTDMRNFTGYVDTSDYLYIGEYKITGYTPKCVHCCGNSEGITKSGVQATIGYTVAAAKNLPLGITLYIEGYGYYVVQDRGNIGDNVIDIASPDHESCYNITKSGINVYVVPFKDTATLQNFN